MKFVVVYGITSLTAPNCPWLKEKLNQIEFTKGCGVLGVENGNALSFALRLRNRNRGMNHTHDAKKEVVSQNV